MVKSALGGGELLCRDVDFCWLPEVQTGCHQAVKPRTKGWESIKTGGEKLAQQQKAHKIEKVQQNPMEKRTGIGC